MSGTQIENNQPESGRRILLLTGATGYVGGRLLRRLEENGERVRCLARSPGHLTERVGESTEVVRGDVLDADSLPPALEGVHTAYYLIHSMGDRGDFASMEQRAAENFARAAREAGVRHIVYLGGLGDESLSEHLESRRRVGDAFRESGITTTEFRCSMIIGSGSASFEMVRALVEHLPVMVTPRWVRKRTQPIAIEDVLDYLVAVLDLEPQERDCFEIGSPDVVTYAELMREFARQRGLKRYLVPVPVLTPRLSSLWLGLVTPLYARVGRKLIDSIRNETVVNDESALQVFPNIRPRSVREAIARALINEDEEFAQTRWSDATSANGKYEISDDSAFGGERVRGRLIDRRSVRIPLAPDEAFAPVARIGGQRGYYYADWLWSLRGFLDLLVGGVGVRRGRRSQEHLYRGDTVDWWRVEVFEPGRRLLLRAEMKVPGRAWLQYEVEPDDDQVGHSVLCQTAVFDPHGLPGLLYWYGIYPLHALVFRGMVRGIRREAEKLAHAKASATPSAAEPV